MNIFSEIQQIQDHISQLDATKAARSNAPNQADAAEFQDMLDSGQMPPEVSAAPEVATGNEAPAPFVVPQQQIDELVRQNAAANGVDPALVKAVIANESGFNASATSNVGAQGLMQLMPETAAGLGVSNPYDAAQNIAGGTRYLAGLLQRFGGNAQLAVAAYNAGPGAVERYRGVPPFDETQRYVTNVLASYNKYRGSA